jgi:hypothetical protein
MARRSHSRRGDATPIVDVDDDANDANDADDSGGADVTTRPQLGVCTPAEQRRIAALTSEVSLLRQSHAQLLSTVATLQAQVETLVLKQRRLEELSLCTASDSESDSSVVVTPSTSGEHGNRAPAGSASTASVMLPASEALRRVVEAPAHTPERARVTDTAAPRSQARALADSLVDAHVRGQSHGHDVASEQQLQRRLLTRKRSRRSFDGAVRAQAQPQSGDGDGDGGAAAATVADVEVPRRRHSAPTPCGGLSVRAPGPATPQVRSLLRVSVSMCAQVCL